MGAVPEILFIDESLTDEAITVGGFIVPASDLADVSGSWRGLKRNKFGVDPSLELKYTLPERHPARQPLDARGWPQAKRVPAMLDRIANMGVTILSDTLIDVRLRANPKDFYLDALSWCMRRFAIHVERIPGPHLVVVDMPSPTTGIENRELSDRLRSLYENVGTAPFDLYEERYRNPEFLRPDRPLGTPFSKLAMFPTLLAAHARHSEHLQVADVIVGCIRDFCHFTVSKTDGWGRLPEPGWQEENLGLIAKSFRRGPRVKGYGFDLWPRDYNGMDEIINRVEALAKP